MKLIQIIVTAQNDKYILFSLSIMAEIWLISRNKFNKTEEMSSIFQKLMK